MYTVRKLSYIYLDILCLHFAFPNVHIVYLHIWKFSDSDTYCLPNIKNMELKKKNVGNTL